MFNCVKPVRVCGFIMAYYGDDVLGDRDFQGRYMKKKGEQCVMFIVQRNLVMCS